MFVFMPKLFDVCVLFRHPWDPNEFKRNQNANFSQKEEAKRVYEFKVETKTTVNEI